MKQAARARILTRMCEIGAFFVAHLSEGVVGRSGEAQGPKFEKHDFRNRPKSPNLLHPLISFIRARAGRAPGRSPAPGRARARPGPGRGRGTLRHFRELQRAYPAYLLEYIVHSTRQSLKVAPGRSRLPDQVDRFREKTSSSYFFFFDVGAPGFAGTG